MECNADLIVPSYSTRYSYKNIEPAGYGSFAKLDSKKVFYPAELACDGETGDESAPVDILVNGEKIGQLPNNRLQTMWHSFIKRGDRVNASVSIENDMPQLSLFYKERSSAAYSALKTGDSKSFIYELNRCSFEFANCIDSYAEFDVDEGEENEPVIAYMGDVLGSIADYEDYRIHDSESIRVFYRSAEKNSDGTYQVFVEVFHSKPVEPVDCRRKQEKTPPHFSVPTMYSINVSFRKQNFHRKAIIKVLVDGLYVETLPNGETITLKLNRNYHILKFMCNSYNDNTVSIEVWRDASVSVQLNSFSKTINVDLH